MEKDLVPLLRAFQERCEQVREMGRNGALSPKGVTVALRKLERAAEKECQA